jgi:hypothetical protein
VNRRPTRTAAPRPAHPTAADDVTMPAQDRCRDDDQPHPPDPADGQRPGKQGQPRPVRPCQPGSSAGAARAGRQPADDAASGSRRPSTTAPGATTSAATWHSIRSGRSASTPRAEDHRTSGQEVPRQWHAGLRLSRAAALSPASDGRWSSARSGRLCADPGGELVAERGEAGDLVVERCDPARGDPGRAGAGAWPAVGRQRIAFQQVQAIRAVADVSDGRLRRCSRTP